MPIGRYTVAAEVRGFRKIVEINQALRIDVKMEIGSTTESVTVEVQTSTVETVSATLGRDCGSQPLCGCLDIVRNRAGTSCRCFAEGA